MDIREEIFLFLKDAGYIECQDNNVVINAKKAFRAAAAYRYVENKVHLGEITDEQVDSFFLCLEKFYLGKADLFWKDSQLLFKIRE